VLYNSLLSSKDKQTVINRKRMVIGMSLPAVLGLGLLSGCSGKDSQAAPDTAQTQKQKDAEAAVKETGGKPEPGTPPNVGQPGNSPK
jgi:hypothetical protein